MKTVKINDFEELQFITGCHNMVLVRYVDTFFSEYGNNSWLSIERRK